MGLLFLPHARPRAGGDPESPGAALRGPLDPRLRGDERGWGLRSYGHHLSLTSHLYLAKLRLRRGKGFPGGMRAGVVFQTERLARDAKHPV